MNTSLSLSNLAPSEGSRKKRKRVGRGESSGIGKTCGKGGKGQTARAGGGIPAHFEGGQMPLYRRLPKIGFTSRKKTLGVNRYTLVPVAVLEAFEEGDIVTPEKLFELGFVPSADEKAGFKLLNDGEVSKKLTVRVHAVSEACCEAIKKAGGVVELIGQ